MIAFAGQTLKSGHFLQPTAMATGQSVIQGSFVSFSARLYPSRSKAAQAASPRLPARREDAAAVHASLAIASSRATNSQSVCSSSTRSFTKLTGTVSTTANVARRASTKGELSEYDQTARIPPGARWCLALARPDSV